MKKVLVPLATGFEELEAVTIINILRRAELDVVTTSLTSDLAVVGSKNMTLTADATLDAVMQEKFDLMVLPGGMPGSSNLEEDSRVLDKLKSTLEQGGISAAICAAPIALKAAGLLDGKNATSYPGFLDVTPATDMTYTGKAVEDEGNIITSRGPGTAMDFALHLVERLAGKAKRDEVEVGLVRD